MSTNNQFIIHGGKQLHGTINSSGAKNAAIKMIAAACLTKDQIKLKNVPLIQDVSTMLEIISGMGAQVEWSKDGELSICCNNIDPEKIDQNKIAHLRGSVVLIGPLVARFGKLRIHEPGGCVIGARPITTHLHALAMLGIKASQIGKYYNFEAKKITGARILLDEISVTTTENVLLAATLAQGTTEIHLAASEPEIANLIDLIIQMGAKVIGKDTNILRIEGQKTLSGASITIIPDRIEIGTFATVIAASRGEATINNVIPDHLDNLLNKFDQIGIRYSFANPLTVGSLSTQINALTIKTNGELKAINFDTRPYPGFSTDLQSQMVVLLTQAKGESKIFETLFEGRLQYTKTLIEMGANIKIIDNHSISVKGPTQLSGKNIHSPDLRAGAAFVMAGIIAQGKTIVDRADIIDRGYEKFDTKLQQLGANIVRE